MLKIFKIFYSIIFIILLFHFGSCTPSDKKESKYNDSVSSIIPEVQEFDINEIIKPIDIAIGDRYICILHDVDGNDDQIFVYNADNLKFKYKFAKKGTGPQETLALDMVKTFRGDTLDLIDQATYKRLTYILEESGPHYIDETYLAIPSVGPLQETYWINDSILIFNTLGNEIITYNTLSEKVISSVNLLTLITGIDDKTKKNNGSFHFSCNNNDIYVGLRNYNEIFKCSLDSTFTLDKRYIKPLKEIEDIENNFNDYQYYAFVSSDGKYVLAQYYGRKLKDMQLFPRNLNGPNLKYDLELFDKDLTPIARYKIDADIRRAFLDGKHNRIYYWDAFEDFDKLKYIKF